MTRLVVIGCVKGKVKHTVPMRDLYTGQLWTARRGYAEASGHDWLILSAGRGLRPPGFRSGPYEAVAADTVGRPAWPIVQAYRLALHLGRHPHGTGEPLDLSGVVLELHAGRGYVDVIRPAFEAAGVVIETPMAGLGIGSQLGWYKQRAAGQLTLA